MIAYNKYGSPFWWTQNNTARVKEKNVREWA